MLAGCVRLETVHLRKTKAVKRPAWKAGGTPTYEALQGWLKSARWMELVMELGVRRQCLLRARVTLSTSGLRSCRDRARFMQQI